MTERQRETQRQRETHAHRERERQTESQRGGERWLQTYSKNHFRLHILVLRPPICPDTVIMKRTKKKQTKKTETQRLNETQGAS